MFSLPLAGLRVIDFTNAVAGPVGARILGDIGAGECDGAAADHRVGESVDGRCGCV